MVNEELDLCILLLPWYLGLSWHRNYNPGSWLPVIEDLFFFLATESSEFSIVSETLGLRGLLLLRSGPWGFWGSWFLGLGSWLVEVKFLYSLWVKSSLDKVVDQGICIVQDFGLF